MGDWLETIGRVALPLALIAFLIWLSVRATRSRNVPDGPSDESYRVYSRDYDLILPADQVEARLPESSPDVDRGHVSNPAEWTRAIADAEAQLEERRFSLDSEVALARLGKASAGLEPRDVVVALLIDQSGSMKGPSMAAATALAALLSELIERFGGSSEILGFTTAGWRGGYPRLAWLKARSPKRPGRLCALMHVIYKTADEACLGVEAREVMVHPDLLRENVDGEAILWARERLMARPEPHKLLIVISDGAPVDDSTLQANGPSFLYRHFMQVVREVEADEQIRIGGVGINHDVEACYWLAETALTPDDVLAATIRLLESMMAARAEQLRWGKEKAGFPPSPE